MCGYNPLPITITNKSYYFSKYFFSWGWATWKHKWDRVDINFLEYKKLSKNDIKKIYPSLIERKIRLKKIRDSIIGKNNSWASPWNFTHQLNGSYSVIYKKNLIKNIGFSDVFSTHTKENSIDNFFLIMT